MKNNNLSPISAATMTFNGLAMIEAATELGLRVLIYKQEDDPSTPDPGPFRIKIMPYPVTANSQSITASGQILAEAMGDLGAASLEMLEGIKADIVDQAKSQQTQCMEDNTEKPMKTIRQEITLLPVTPLRTIDHTKPLRWKNRS